MHLFYLSVLPEFKTTMERISIVQSFFRENSWRCFSSLKPLDSCTAAFPLEEPSLVKREQSLCFNYKLVSIITLRGIHPPMCPGPRIRADKDLNAGISSMRRVLIVRGTSPKSTKLIRKKKPNSDIFRNMAFKIMQ